MARITRKRFLKAYDAALEGFGGLEGDPLIRAIADECIGEGDREVQSADHFEVIRRLSQVIEDLGVMMEDLCA